ncbi:MAG: hypothetical protein ABI679_09680 [Gemmatimonadota bacterium]
MSRRTLALNFVVLLAVAALSRQAVAQSSQFPDGVYLVVVQAGDGIQAAPGVYMMSFDGHGVFQLQRDTLVMVMGAYTSRGDTLEVEDEEGPERCTAPSIRGAYRWTLASDGLSLKPVRDPCRGWRSMLTVRPIARKH